MLSILLKSRIAWAGAAFLLALSWHYIDKAAAVRSAEKELADLAEITSLKSQLAETERRERIALNANKTLLFKAMDAQDLAVQAEKELEEYVNTTVQNNQCVVDDSLLGKLRNK